MGKNNSRNDGMISLLITVWIVLLLLVCVTGVLYFLARQFNPFAENESTMALIPYTTEMTSVEETTVPETMKEVILQTVIATQAQEMHFTGEAQTKPVEYIGINAFYVGDANKEGQGFRTDDVIVVGYYSDGDIEELTEFTIEPAVQALAAGDNFYTVSAKGLHCEFCITAKKTNGMVTQTMSGKTEVKREDGWTTKETKENEEDSFQEEDSSEQEITTEKRLRNIAVYWIGGERMEGEYIAETDLQVDAYYTDGSMVSNVQGWYCKEVGHTLKKGENFLTIYYQSKVELLSVTGE